ncbi:BREX-4 system phosphatase PglZ [Acetobacterium wieringae]|uniref:BREX-4 system phosphatase PglZ n=1 Tax=Acetobacterium wieringae TaxID=52694 RepID=A0ABY6H9M4_9FIRM|nr:BREX-4 system phosphatase PglZ [Acetobacterium wieringae]UYO61173.1 BREX-4 system phosphatase PglZ [Acetobacterium wieringae]
MKFDECIKRVDRYLRSTDTQPRFVNIQNMIDLGRIKQHFHVGLNEFIEIESYCKEDENPNTDSLLNDLYHKQGVVFITGLTSFFMLCGEIELKRQLSQLIHFTTTNCHIVVLCYQCEKYLVTEDVRLERIIYNVDGEESFKPSLVFCPPEIPHIFNGTIIEGINRVANAVETINDDILYIRTRKHKSSYPHSLYHITEQNGAFEVLCTLDPSTNQLDINYGTTEQWTDALIDVSKHASWATLFTEIFSSFPNLELTATNWKVFDDKTKWLYFIALKIFGAKNNWCLNSAAPKATSVNSLIRCLFRSILSLDWNETDFWTKYAERKALLLSFGNPESEVLDYCAMVKSKGKYALYYLTDSTKAEQVLIFETLDTYAFDFSQEEVIGILKEIYPDLYDYLRPYRFKNDLLHSYFQTYKYEKVINKVFPEFENLVEEQAEKREYNLILPPRTEKIESIDKTDTHLYFIDAMGVEYLGFIMEKCRQKDLFADVTVCRCELPSITSCNKEFVEVFANAGAVLVPDKNGIKTLDEIKHHGQDDYDYRITMLPIHLIRELEIIEGILDKIKIKLANGVCRRVVMISDHGASRLSVISNRENKWEMATKGEHSGRCCPKNEINELPICATEENGFWVLANYDRFKGSRKANVEVHGGATLEEVTIPIIEITYRTLEIEIEMLTPEIIFNIMKKNAEIRLFSKTKLTNLSVSIAEKDYDAETSDGHVFLIKLLDLRKTGDYSVDVYTNNNKVATGLKFTANKEGLKENKLL